jgi:hypothetical protein
MTLRGRPACFAALHGAALLLVTLGGCSLGFHPKEAKLVKQCILPKDQVGTLAGHWKALPIPISFHQGDFGEEEISAITAAANTWNQFYSATQGIKRVLDYGGDQVNTSTAPVPTDACSQGLLQGGVFTGSVVIYKQGVWPHPGAGAVMALTSFCTTPGSPLPVNYMAYMELNYQGFFRQGLQIPDIQTIVAHEFGHLLGLYHSCDPGSTTAGKPDCNKKGISEDYQDALMFPSFSFNSDLSGEQKRTLQANDQGRANCLYGEVGGVK